MHWRFGALIIGLTLAGCATQIMTSYVGKPLTQPIIEYGPPVAAYDMGDGRRAFVWVQKVQVVRPGFVSTTGNANAISTGSVRAVGNQASYSGQTTANLYANTTILPPTQSSYDCHYAIFARKTRDDIDGPAAWQVVGFNPPKLKCE